MVEGMLLNAVSTTDPVGAQGPLEGSDDTFVGDVDGYDAAARAIVGENTNEARDTCLAYLSGENGGILKLIYHSQKLTGGDSHRCVEILLRGNFETTS